MADCTELNNLRGDVSSVEINDSNRAKFLSNYIDAYLACNPGQQDVLVKAVAEGRGGAVNSVAKAITADMGIDDNESLEIDILEQLAQISESKRPISGDAQKDDRSHLGADPVMLFKGQFVHEVDDIHISGAGINFLFKRTYKNQVVFNGPLGYNWIHNFHIWLREANQTIFRSTGDLREEVFTRHPKFEEGPTDDFDYWIPPDGKHGVIFSENNSFVLRQSDGSRQIFEPDPGHSFLHRIKRIEDRFGNYLRLHYDEDQRLVHIEINHPKRLVNFEYDTQERICLIRDHTDRRWCYRYDSIGDLIAVTSPSTERYDCGSTVNYDYSSAFHSGNLQHNLVRIIDAADQIYLETEYGTSSGLLNFNRVVRQRQGGGEYLFEYEDIDQIFDFEYPDEQRPAHQTILVERNGQPVTHIYNRFGNLLQREQCVTENGLLRTLVEQYRYDRDGNVVSSLSPEGVFTQHLFGRDFFARHHGLTENGDLPTGDLTWKERQAFGRIRATVRRGGYASFDSFILTRGIWGEFPDILNGLFPVSILDRSQDIIVKMTYEEEFGQLITVSDPRYTDSADPDAINEHPRHNDTLTKYFYSGPTKFLSKIEYPQTTLPDGLPGPVVLEEFTNYDPKGRLLRSVNSIGVVTKFSYFDDQSKLSFGHLRQTVVDVAGFDITVRYEVDELGRVTTVHSPKSISATDGRFVTHSRYNELDQIVETTSTSPFNFKTHRFYNRNGKLEREEHDLGDENGQPELGRSAVATFCYDEEFNLVESTVGGLDLAAHLVTKHCYDSAGKRALTVLPNGNQMRVRYDERQLPVSQIAGAGSEDAATIRTDYDGDGRVRHSFDARGNPTSYDFDAFGRVIAQEDALGHIIRTDYDKASNITCIRVFENRPEGYFLLARNETEFDELNRAVRSGTNRYEAPVGPFAQTELRDAQFSTPGPGDLLETKTFYDAKGRVEKTVDPIGRETHLEYDALDRCVTVVDPLGNKSFVQYDAHDNAIRTDQIDRVLAEDGTETDRRFFASSSTYDELDRLTSSTDSLGNVTRLFYDSRNNVVRQVDPLGNEQHASFDIFNRPITLTRFLTSSGLGPVTPSAVSVTTSQEYDRNGNLTAVIDALGRRTSYDNDALDRRRAVIHTDGTRMLTSYDVDGNIIRTQDNNGVQRKSTIDALGRTIRVDIDTSGKPADLEVAGATFEQYEYDGLDRQTAAKNDFAICTYKYNSVSSQLAETIQFTVSEAQIKTPFTISREFDDVGALVGLTYPDGRKLQLERDELNRLTAIQNLANGNSYPGHANSPDVRLIAQMSYAGRQRSQCSFVNGANTTYRHDGASRVIEIDHTGPNGALLAIQYLYDAANNVRVRNDVLPAGPSTERFAYDSLYRLAHEFNPDTSESLALTNFGPASDPLAEPPTDRQSTMNALIGSLELPQIPLKYDYDRVGNREIERLEDDLSVDYVTNQLDQYLSRNGTNYTHDANGNLTKENQRSYIYDSFNRLVSASETIGGDIALYWHDASGRRILEHSTEEGTFTQLIHDGDDIVSEYQDGDLSAQYVFDDGIDRPMHISAGEMEHWYQADLVGSVRLLTNAAGEIVTNYRYSSFGDALSPANGSVFNPWQYTGRRFDSALSSYHYRARQYDPSLGRFLERDPSAMIDGTNLYTYTLNNPLSALDPSGLSRKEAYLFDLDDMSDSDPFVDGHTYAQAAEYGIYYEEGRLWNAMSKIGSALGDIKAKGDDLVMDGEYALRNAFGHVIEFAMTPVDWVEENTCGHRGCSAFTGSPPVNMFGRLTIGLRIARNFLGRARQVTHVAKSSDIAAEVASLRRMGDAPMLKMDARLVAKEEILAYGMTETRSKMRSTFGPAVAVSHGETSRTTKTFLNNQHGELPAAMEGQVYARRFAKSEAELAKMPINTKGPGTHAEFYGMNYQRLQGNAFSDISLFVYQTPWQSSTTLRLWRQYGYMRPFPACVHCANFTLGTRFFP